MAINFPCRGKICLFNLTKRKQFLQLLEETELITELEPKSLKYKKNRGDFDLESALDLNTLTRHSAVP
ncbi:conserved hypothetical protein [Culex quinquefasciatus]|uniref:Uncharacterized protein n=1 Tax=Culex quinquefasciatus TaxID=7176 RepID=B0XHA0_CULQU|nr:conserved hypothetical protein [Culex quinquefasciatus]|eukprot:XP_001869022.1 conserved hypothetical protein [Culex quinquefasciatus]